MIRILLALWLSAILVRGDALAGVEAPPAGEVSRLGLDPFYEKYLGVGGFPVVSSGKVSDHALMEAGFLIERMLGHRPDVLEAITRSGVRLVIMAPDEFTTQVPEHSHLAPREYWDKRARGLGSTAEHPAVSCGEENLLGYAGDPYATENILIHEFAHTVHQQGMAGVDPSFQGRLESIFARAKLKGLWKGKYAGTNPSEYWAEAVQSWFDCNRENDFEHNHVNTREELKAYDPELASLVASVFGDGDWRYQKPGERAEPGHLAGFDAAAAPVFSWPEELVAAYEAIREGKDLEPLPRLPLASLDSGEHRSPRREGARSVSLRVDNRTDDTIRIYWIDFEGARKDYGQADPGRNWEQSTFAGHLWLVTDPEGAPLAFFAAGDKPGRVVIP